MKIRPVILCGGAGTRLWPNLKNTQAKQFIDFGGWTLLQKAFERINNNSYDFPIISTNLKYLKDVKKTLKKSKIKKYKIILEPAKKNTAPAILVSALIKDIPNNQPVIFFSADQRIEKVNILKKALNTFNDDHHVVKTIDKKAYLSALAISNYIVVTCDSTSMISEAAITLSLIHI